MLAEQLSRIFPIPHRNASPLTFITAYHSPDAVAGMTPGPNDGILGPPTLGALIRWNERTLEWFVLRSVPLSNHALADSWKKVVSLTWCARRHQTGYGWRQRTPTSGEAMTPAPRSSDDKGDLPSQIGALKRNPE